MSILNSVDQLMVIAAFRHCLGSRTYMSGACVQWLHDNWPQLTEKCQNVIARELEEAFRSDDLALDSHPHMVRIFDDISRSTWMRLRDFYLPSHNIEELVSRITPDNRPGTGEIDFGPPVGRELL